MNLSISNIAWSEGSDTTVYNYMNKLGFSGLEIAPTRIFPEEPYDHIDEAARWSEALRSEYKLKVPSMQSIWYGRSEKLFGSREERESLLAYTKKAIDFAEAIGCGNLVFGCPRNRILPESGDVRIAEAFFREAGYYAHEHHTVLAMEANPPIYNTNFINSTIDALELIKSVGSPGFKLNLDTGTMIENREEVSVLEGNVHLINHVHISEPGLEPVRNRELHGQLAEILRHNDYSGFVSIEVRKQDDTGALADMMEYVKSVFG
ncbi:MAG: sugar phosphate isomerase/epimerase [Clostridiales bacterium]|nr:sugar phosphate isomerase/epimerase [Clostridiales bacterium]